MDPDTYARAREHFFRLQDMPPADRQAALDALISDEPELGRYVASLIEAEDTESGDLFENAVKRGMEDKVRDMSAALDLPEGQRINAMTIISRLGDGGFGDVYLAHQDGPNRNVALKIIKAGMDTARVLRRFEHEKQLLAALEHPNIARLYDAGHTPQALGSRPYFVMEYVDGPPITRYCDQHELPPAERVRVFINACKAVQHAHNKGIIHRDLKPSNILVATEDDRPVPKVIDFGIAKALDDRYAADTRHTLEGQVIGTLDYMSPEQADGSGQADTRTDVYALGVVLYRLLTGTLPFDTYKLGEVGTTEAYRIIREVDPKNPSSRVRQADPPSTRSIPARVLKRDLDWITLKCLEKDPGRRYASVNELIADLDNYLSGRPVAAGAPSIAYKLGKFVRRNTLPVAVASILLLAGSIALVIVIASLAREASTRVERDEYQAKVVQLEEANTKLEISETRTREVNSELQTRNAQLAETQTELESKNAQLEQQSKALQIAVEETTRLADQERQAKEDAQRAREQLATANGELTQALEALDASLDETQEARERAEAALVLAEENARLAAEAAARADTEADNFRRLYDEAEQSVSVLTQGDHIPTDVLERIADALGSEAFLRAQILERLAQRALADADMTKAIEAQRSALSAFTGALGSDHRSTLAGHLSLVELLQRAGRTVQAKDQLDLVITAAHRSFEPGDPIFTEVDLARANALLHQKKLGDALALITQVIESLEAQHGPYHPRTLSAVRHRAMVHAAMSNPSQAEADYRRVLVLNSSADDDAREDLAIAANNLAVLLRERGNLSEAQAMLARAVWVARGVWGPANWRTAMVQAQHASVLAAQRDFEDAETKLLEAHAILSTTLGDRHTETRAVARELFNLYTSWDQAEGSTRHAGKASRWQSVLVGTSRPAR